MALNCRYFLSDEAFNNLVTQAKHKGFIRDHIVIKARGLNNYVIWLSQQQFIDTRPAYASQADAIRLQANKLPYWSKELTRTRHMIVIDLTTRERLREIATQHLISNHTRKDSLIREQTSTISALLEAIGLGWLSVQEVS